MSTTLIIILCAVGAFIISLAISYFATRKLVSQRLHFLSEFVPDDLVDISNSDYCMAKDLKSDDTYIIGFGNDEISLFIINVIGGEFKVEKPVNFKLEQIKSIELTSMRTKTILIDNEENSVEFSVTQESSKEIFSDFPCDIDLNDCALRYYDFVQNLKGKINN